MNEKTLIDTKEANRLMRSPSGSGSVFVQPEVMFSLIHLLESFEVNSQLRAFIQVVPRLVVRAAEWTHILHSRILNDAVACAAYEEILLLQQGVQQGIQQGIQLGIPG